jgi:HPt (histidine-containing phosphotransfer) domain-containing protein
MLAEVSRSAPTAEELQLLDPDGSFVERLAADRLAILRLIETGHLEELGPILHRLAGAAGTFGFAEIGDLAIALDDGGAPGKTISAVDAARLGATINRVLESPEKSA